MKAPDNIPDGYGVPPDMHLDVLAVGIFIGLAIALAIWGIAKAIKWINKMCSENEEDTHE